MITRRKVLGEAADKCMRELYSYAQPKVDYDDFLNENKEYLKKEEEYYSIPKDERPPYVEYMGAKPYEFYYLPQNFVKEICDSYVDAYKIDEQQNLLDIIDILKNYCDKPIVNKYIGEYTDEEGNYHPGHRGYDEPDNLKKELVKLIKEYDSSAISESIAEECHKKFFEFLDMAGDFFSWNGDLNAFNMAVYLGASPSSSKERVIENWKKYRNKDIEIDDSVYNEFFEED